MMVQFLFLLKCVEVLNEIGQNIYFTFTLVTTSTDQNDYTMYRG